MITIIIPVFNEEAYVLETLSSIRTQNYSDFECLVINDGSTDLTPQIVGEFISTDTRFKMYSQKNMGKNSAINFGIEHASGDWITLFSGDDTMPENALFRLNEIANEYKPREEKIYISALVHSFADEAQYDHENDILIAPPSIDGLFGNSIGMISNKLARECFPIPTKYPNEDTWLRLCFRYFSDIRVQSDIVLFNYRIHANNSYDHNASFRDFSESYHARRIAIWEFAEANRNRLSPSTYNDLMSLKDLEMHRFNRSVLRIFSVKGVSRTEKFKALMQANPMLYYIKKKLSKYYMGRTRA